MTSAFTQFPPNDSGHVLMRMAIGPMTIGRVVALGMLAALLGRPALAQGARSTDLHGVVRDSASGEPVRGAVVTALDDKGTVLGRNVTGERGRYRLLVQGVPVRVQLLRLGYRPATLRAPDARTDSGTDSGGASGSAAATRDVLLDVRMVLIPTLVQRVLVSGKAPGSPAAGAQDGSRCPGSPEQRFGAQALLEQVRAGLLSMVVARDSNPARVVRLGYVRDLDPVGQKILRQRVRIDSALRATASFNAARTPGELVQAGFRVTSGATQTLFAPDAEVLLDDAFAAGYCFRVVADGARAGQVGLGFAPVSRRRDRIDIDGTLWVDTVARRMVDVEFRYLGLDAISTELGAGGRIAFREMPSGVLFIDRWWLRLVGAPDSALAYGDGERLVRMYSLTEIGGELASASWGDGQQWTSTLGSAQLLAVNEEGMPMPNVSMGLLGTDYAAQTDSTGRAVIRYLLPGPYAAFVADERLAAIGLTLPTALRFDARRGSVQVRRFIRPTTESFIAASCGHDPSATSTPASLLARALTSPDDTLLPLHWQLRKLVAGRWRSIADVKALGASELFQQCIDLADGETIQLEVSRAGQEPERVIHRLTRGVTVLPVVLPSIAEAAAIKASVTLEGTVHDSLTGQPVNEARVSVVGTLRETVTDSAGHFLLSRMPRGVYDLEVGSAWLDSIGAVKRVRITAAGDSTPIRLYMPSAAQLATATCGSSASASDASGSTNVGVIVGKVALPDRVDGLPGIALIAEWPEADSVAAGVRAGGNGTAPTLRSVRTRTSERGTFKLCGVPLDRSIRLRTAPESTLLDSASPTTVRVGARRFARMDLTLTHAPRIPK